MSGFIRCGRNTFEPASEGADEVTRNCHGEVPVRPNGTFFQNRTLFFALSTEHNQARCRWSPPPIELALCVRSLSFSCSFVSCQSMDLSVVPEVVHFNELAIAK